MTKEIEIGRLLRAGCSVSHDERNQVEQMLVMELRRNDGETNEGSHKQSAKSLAGRDKFG